MLGNRGAPGPVGVKVSYHVFAEETMFFNFLA